MIIIKRKSRCSMCSKKEFNIYLIIMVLLNFVGILDAMQQKKVKNLKSFAVSHGVEKKLPKTPNEFCLSSALVDTAANNKYQAVLDHDLYKAICDGNSVNASRLLKLSAHAVHPDILHKGVLLGNTQLVADLLKAHANIDKQDWAGETPLHIAVGQGYVEIVKELVLRGADCTIADRTGTSAITLARLSNNKEIKEYLGK